MNGDSAEQRREMNVYLDPVTAAVALADRCGAAGFEMDCADVDNLQRPDWWATVQFKGVKLMTSGHKTAAGCAIDLAERLLSVAFCRCGERVALADGPDGCRWRLNGARWVSSCDAPPVPVTGNRGDLAAMGKALQPVVNRAARRREERRRR